MTCAYVPVRDLLRDDIGYLMRTEYAQELVNADNFMEIMLKALKRNNLRLVSDGDPLEHRVQM